VRNSLIEIMSSVGLKSGIALPPLSMLHIVRNRVRKVNGVPQFRRSAGGGGECWIREAA
jgi:hypothetical protein